MSTQLLTYPVVVDHEIRRRLRDSEEERRRRLVRRAPAPQRLVARLSGRS